MFISRSVIFQKMAFSSVSLEEVTKETKSNLVLLPLVVTEVLMVFVSNYYSQRSQQPGVTTARGSKSHFDSII